MQCKASVENLKTRKEQLEKKKQNFSSNQNSDFDELYEKVCLKKAEKSDDQMSVDSSVKSEQEDPSSTSSKSSEISVKIIRPIWLGLKPRKKTSLEKIKEQIDSFPDRLKYFCREDVDDIFKILSKHEASYQQLFIEVFIGNYSHDIKIASDETGLELVKISYLHVFSQFLK